jgi:hypothetical protein
MEHENLVLSGGAASPPRQKENPTMHDAIIALAFIAMLLAPCVTAAITGKSNSEEAA